MNRNINTLTETDSPSSYAASLAGSVAAQKTAFEKRKLGQYFTPLQLAKLCTGSLPPGFAVSGGKVRILDPGAGTAVLSCILIEKLCETSAMQEIELTCYESDIQTAQYTAASLEYLKNWLNSKDIRFHYDLITDDFIHEYNYFMNSCPPMSGRPSEKFDLIISNPPFFKLDANSPYLSDTDYEFRYHLNIYHLFLFVSANLLVPDGSMVFIIPSSFFSGGYFAVLRQSLLNIVELKKVLYIKSTGGIFETDSVLSDTVIITLGNTNCRSTINQISVESLSGFPDSIAFSYTFSTSKVSNIFPLFSRSYEKLLFDRLQSWPTTLSEAGYRINEGHLLASEAERKNSGGNTGASGTAYFIRKKKYLSPVKDISEKPIYETETIAVTEDLFSVLQPARNLVIIRRYNAKDTVPVKSSPFLAAAHTSQTLIIDKRLLFLDKPDGEMTEAETLGLTVYLNSNLLRKYIGITYGKINLTAQEYLNLPCPPEKLLSRTGSYFLNHYYPADHP